MSTQTNTSVMDALASRTQSRVRGKSIISHVFPLVLLAVFVVVDLLALVAGTQAYRTITNMESSNDVHLMTVGPLASSVRANDARGAVRKMKDGPEGETLVLIESVGADTYETRIYLYEGNIMQEYALSGTPYAPERATVLAKSATFSFEYKDGLLTLHTDAGITKVALRNMQGGE